MFYFEFSNITPDYYILNIQNSGLSIYSEISPSNQELFIPINVLEDLLNSKMKGVTLTGLPLRSRSKVVKSKICEALGYPVSKSFKKTHPRFPGQNFDVYSQKSLNVQIWNEEIDPNRRYVFIQVNDDDVITKVRVITGEELASYDKTGTLTHKYQATMSSKGKSILLSPKDTEKIEKWANSNDPDLKNTDPNSEPQRDKFLRIAEVYNRLLPIVGRSIDYIDAIQERNRGAELHKLICEHLGYSKYEDDGSYPDLANQLIEIKLQTSPTIDLGLHSPSDGSIVINTSTQAFFSEDIRYVIFEGEPNKDRSKILLKYLYLVNGKDFSTHFPLFKGKEINSKLQFPLPPDFFD